MEGVADAFVERIQKLAAGVRPGHPLHAGVTMGPSISGRQLEKVLEYMEIGKGEATLRAGGAREESLPHGYFAKPTVFDAVSPSGRIATEEIFGPVLSVIRVASPEEALKVANGVEFGLTAAVFTRDLSRAFMVASGLETGIVQVNAPTMGGEAQLPFGGCKSTGVGPKEMGPEAWKFFAEPKTVYINHRLAPRTVGFY
jgi:aldehyde dehydrogenase (NAD+)